MSTIVGRHEIGNLDQRITIKRETMSQTGMGGQELTLTNLATVWAKVRPRSGTERNRFERLDAEASYIFVIRNRPDLELRESDRIEWRGTEYNIRFISDPGPRPIYIEISADKGVAQ